MMATPFDFLHMLLGVSGGGDFYQPPFDDPAKFPRAAPIMDDDSILRLAEMDKLLSEFAGLRKEMSRIQDRIDVVKADLDSHKVRLFQRMRALYPSITEGYGYGWRKFGEPPAYYVVGWDPPKEQEEE